MSQFNFPGNATTAVMLAAASCANTAAATGTGVDLKDYEGPVLIVQNHGTGTGTLDLSLIHISEPTRPCGTSRMPSSA